ncbi:lectin-like protein At1g53070 [Aristolochia californica]|uniref:lectin-like protein At1g53070 n=1 Tax=Aristolochia californica TaxID=171875 RepID=UPI0035D75BFB
MEIVSASRYSTLLLYLGLCFVALATTPIFSFSFSKFDSDLYFDSQITLYGDAEVGGNDSSVRLTRPSVTSFGRIMSKRPMKISPRNPTKIVSFWSYFSFAISPGNTDGLAFFMVPRDLWAESLNNSSFGVSPGVVAVEFDTFKDNRFEDPNGNHIGLDIGSLVSVVYNDALESKLVLNSGDKLHCWIDYDLNSRRLEARLSKSGVAKPLDPLISYHINLSEMFGRGVFVGISSSSRNATQATSVYSWSLEFKRIANFIHSQPLDPRTVVQGTEQKLVRYKSDYLLRTLAGMILGAGCGAMIALLVLCVWSMLENKHRLAPASEYPIYPVEVGYKKIIVNGGKRCPEPKK